MNPWQVHDLVLTHSLFFGMVKVNKKLCWKKVFHLQEIMLEESFSSSLF